MTNREWLTTLTDKELGYFLFCGLSCDVSCMEDKTAKVNGLRCAHCGAKWLQGEHRDNDIPDDFDKLKTETEQARGDESKEREK